MEKPVELEQKPTLMNELIQGQKLAKELLNHLRSTSSLENRGFLISEILSSYERSLSVLNSVASIRDNNNIAFGNTTPTSEFSFQDSKQSSVVFKKRKTTIPRWTEKVRVRSVTGSEGALDDDGYSWRKYGQKDILGANYPRAYYRCTHRKTLGCMATKQVQRSDKQGEMFEVNYIGKHTCRQTPKLSPVSKQLSKQEWNGNEDQCQGHEQVEIKQSHIEATPFALETQLKTEDLDSDIGFKMDDIFPSFSFPPPIETEFNNPIIEFENNLLGSFSPSFISPANSESDIYLMSQCHKSSFGGVHTPESDIITEIPSNQTSVTNSPIGDWDFTLDDVGIELNFPFDDPEVFS